MLRGIFRAENRAYVVGDVDDKAHFATRFLKPFPFLYWMRPIEACNFAPANVHYAYALKKPLSSPFETSEEIKDDGMIESPSLVMSHNFMEHAACGLLGIEGRDKLVYRVSITSVEQIHKFMSGQVGFN